VPNPSVRNNSQHKIQGCKQKKYAIYVKRNIEARSHNYCCRGKEINITHSECVSVDSII